MATKDDSDKKPRLFVYGRCSNDTWSLCGGPEVAKAVKGLMRHLEGEVYHLFRNGEHGDSEDISIEVRMMTDEEVKNLPDL